MTRWIIPPLRRFVQLLSLSVLVMLPLAALYTHYHQARALGDLPEDSWRGAALRAIDDTVGESPERLAWIETTQGTIWSARIRGISLTDPLAGAESIVSSREFYVPLLLSLLIPLAITLLLGRVFCGWICPMNTLLEVVDRCRRLLRWAEIRDRDVKFSLRNKYVVLGLTLGLVAVTGIPFLALVYPPAVLSREVHLFVFGGVLGAGTYLVLAVCAVELFVSRRWWCRYVCPGGALYSLLGRFRLVRVRRDESRCVQCGDCVRACQFDLKPMIVQFTGMECTNCASCISSCQSRALQYRLVLPLPLVHRPPPSNPESRAPHDSPSAPPADHPPPARVTKASLVALALGLAASWATPASAHHILGLPHYSYKENYPQVPTLEYPATTGPYDVLMTSFPGHPVPGEPTMIAFYIKNRTTDEPFAAAVSVRVLRTSTLGTNQVIREPAIVEPLYNEHKLSVKFPEDGEYVVELTLDVEGRSETISFLVVAGNPSATVSVLISIGGGLALFVVLVRAIKLKRKRRSAWKRRTSGPRRTEPSEARDAQLA